MWSNSTDTLDGTHYRGLSHLFWRIDRPNFICRFGYNILNNVCAGPTIWGKHLKFHLILATNVESKNSFMTFELVLHLPKRLEPKCNEEINANARMRRLRDFISPFLSSRLGVSRYFFHQLFYSLRCFRQFYTVELLISITSSWWW